MNKQEWWTALGPNVGAQLEAIWIPVGVPGHAGAQKGAWKATLDTRFGPDGWRIRHYVRGALVEPAVAILEYEESYRRHLRQQPQLVDFLVTHCGNVYDDQVSNVYDSEYHQPQTLANHYQDIAVRRVIAELAEDSDWPSVTPTAEEETELIDLNDGQRYNFPRAQGFRGLHLLQLREPDTPGFLLNPAVVPVHDPSLIITHPRMEDEWYLDEGCQHLSVEAFWQMSKVIETRYDRFLALQELRDRPLAGVV